MFTELSLGCWSSGRRNLSMYQVSSSTVFFFVSYMDNTCPFIVYCQDTILKEVKGLTNKLHAFALAQKKTGLPATFQVHRCYG